MDDFHSFLKNNENFIGQNLQDAWVMHNTKEKKNGYFVDIGAADGKEISNSFLLEKKYMWNGIVAEPNPIWHKNLIKNRNCNISLDCVWSESEKILDFIMADDPVLSTIQGFGEDDEHAQKRKTENIIKVKTISLLDLLKKYNAPRNIDYVSIDTEGSEFEILRSFFENNKDQYVVDLFTVEHNFVEDYRNKIFLLMKEYGYERVNMETSRWDDFYKRVVS